MHMKCNTRKPRRKKIVPSPPYNLRLYLIIMREFHGQGRDKLNFKIINLYYYIKTLGLMYKPD